MSSAVDAESHLHDFLPLASRPEVTLSALLEAVLDSARSLSGADSSAALMVAEAGFGSWTVKACSTYQAAQERAVRSLSKWLRERPPVASNCRSTPLSFENPEEGRDDLPLGSGSRSVLVVELAEHRELLGALLLESTRTDYFRESRRKLLEELAAAASMAIRRMALREQLAEHGYEVDLVGISPAFLHLERQAKQAAAFSRGSVLIVGERGTGKELTAHAIHAWSGRSQGPFVPVLASALSGSLVADELYGHKRDAFTGARRRREGKFKAAHGGTIFLDEVADMPLSVQSALLRVVERGEVQRVGEDQTTRVDVRVVAATNRDLRKLISRRAFRSDLYDRLSVFEIKVPPLRERRQDIPLLANHFLHKYCDQMRRFIECGRQCPCPGCPRGSALECVDGDFYRALQEYRWPGNVRELANLMMRLLVTVEDGALEVRHLPQHIRGNVTRPVPTAGCVNGVWPDAQAQQDLSLEGVMRRHIEEVLSLCGYNQSRAAEALQLPYSTLQSKMKRLGIRIPARNSGQA